MDSRVEPHAIEARARRPTWLGTSVRGLAAMICLAAGLLGGSLWIEHEIAGPSQLAGLDSSPMQPALTPIR